MVQLIAYAYLRQYCKESTDLSAYWEELSRVIIRYYIRNPCASIT